jgi:hypothetical protein
MSSVVLSAKSRITIYDNDLTAYVQAGVANLPALFNRSNEVSTARVQASRKPTNA